MPPANLAPHDHAKRHSGRLGRSVEDVLSRLGGQDVHVIVIHEQRALVRGGEGHGLFADDGVFPVRCSGVAPHVLVLGERVHGRGDVLLAFLGDFGGEEEGRVGGTAARRACKAEAAIMGEASPDEIEIGSGADGFDGAV